MKGLLRIVAFCIAAAVFAGEAVAADFYVATTGDDAADGSQASPFATLPVAIAAANSAIGGGEKSVTIHVASGTYTGSGYVLDKAVTVQGAGAGETIFDGNGGYRIFSLLSSGAQLKNVTVKGGKFTASGQQGAGVYMEAGLIEDCWIDSCGSNTAATYGGGVYASGGRINRTKFTGCRVYATYSGNIGYGSALYLCNGAVCENSLFTGNAAATCTNNRNRGGVVHLTGSGTALVNCSVVKNDIKRGDGNVESNFTGIFQTSNAKVVNCVAYMNCPSDFYSKEKPRCDVYGSQNCFVNSAWDANSYTVNGGAINNSIASPIAINDNSFADYAGGNYAPAKGGALHDAGSGTEYNAFAMSATDITGALRSQGASIDIGCYEVKETAFVAVLKVDSYGILLGTKSMFTVVAAGGSENYKYKWNFGDGSEDVMTDLATVSHTYAAAGLYHASVSVSDDGGTTWPVTPVLKSAIAVAPAHLYVDAASENPTFPYDTPEKSAATLSDALNCLTNTFEETLNMAVVDGVTIHVAKGTYMGVGYALAGDVTIVGEGAAKTVFDGNGGYRIFSLMAPGATLKSLCVSNAAFKVEGEQGAGVYMEAGLVEDCRIDSCGNTIKTTYGGGVYASGGRINRTKFTGCKVHMMWNEKGWGSALYLCNGAVCENSLFTGNAAPSHDLVNPYGYRGGVVHLTGDKTLLVNCTVVKNDLKRGEDKNTGAKRNFAGIVQRSSAKVINCVAYMNCPADFDAVDYGDVVGAANCFINSAWNKAMSGSSPVSPIVIDELVFKNYANGNFAPKSGAALVNAGSDWETYLANGARSTTDFAGAKRLSGKKLDIGCYEVSNGGYWLIVR